MHRYALQPGMGRGQKVAHYFGAAIPVCVPWYLATWAGAVAGTAIPAGLALDFAVPITFIALFAPALRTLPHIAAAVVAVTVALALSFLPYNLWLIVAAVAGMLTGSLVELWQERRR
jgi:predicted branched-subunit amino acid permease